MQQLHGLKESEVTQAREKYGNNVIPDSEPTTFWKEFRESFSLVMHRFMNRWEPSWQFWWLLL